MRLWPFKNKREPSPEEPLSGGRPRLKTYSAQTGYAYQYFFEGFRRTQHGWEYVFSASADRKTWRSLTIELEQRTVERWEAARRQLTPSERHGIAKMTLFAAFDRYEPPPSLPDRLRPSLEQMERIAAELDL